MLLSYFTFPSHGPHIQTGYSLLIFLSERWQLTIAKVTIPIPLLGETAEGQASFINFTPFTRDSDLMNWTQSLDLTEFND